LGHILGDFFINASGHPGFCCLLQVRTLKNDNVNLKELLSHTREATARSGFD
jgi:hypothetical protein